MISSGLIAPNAFLPIAENLGILRDIDKCVLEKSVSYLQDIDRAGLILPKLNINISFAHLSDPEFIDRAKSIPKTNTSLVFEVVETVFLDHRKNIEAWQLDRLRDFGIGLELDDFGTGHASVAALTKLQPDRLKLDRSFVSPLPDPSYAKLVGSIVDMGRALNIASTAEGVETPEQASRLRDLGVDVYQGFLFSRPVPFEDLAAKLQSAPNGSVSKPAQG